MNEQPKKPKKTTKAERLQNAAQEVLDAIEEVQNNLQPLEDTFNAARDTFNDAVQAYVDAQSAYTDAKADLDLQVIEDALQNLRDVREEEYQGWYDNMPEGLQEGPTGSKLQELLDIDLEPPMPELPELPDIEEISDEWEEIDFSDVESAAQQILDADLPLGFGKD